MTEETPTQKIQAEYNRLVSLLGHNFAQSMVLTKERERLESRIEKILSKASNLPKEEVEQVKENTEETKDGTNG